MLTGLVENVVDKPVRTAREAAWILRCDKVRKKAAPACRHFAKCESTGARALDRRTPRCHSAAQHEEHAMRQEEFTALLQRMMASAQRGDAQGFAACFTPDGLYHDYIYGDHQGRPEIARMLRELFHRDAREYRWEMFDPVCHGDIAYAWSLSSFVSSVPEFDGRRVVIDGMSRFQLKDGLIADYSESVNGGVAMVQLGVAAPRIEKVLQRWSKQLVERPATQAFLARANPR
jgi:ketosteroid isomerase-like protein